MYYVDSGVIDKCITSRDLKYNLNSCRKDDAQGPTHRGPPLLLCPRQQDPLPHSWRLSPQSQGHQVSQHALGTIRSVTLSRSAGGEQEGDDVGETSLQEVTIQAAPQLSAEGAHSPTTEPLRKRRRRGGRRYAAKMAKKQGGPQEPLPTRPPSPGSGEPLPHVKAFHKTYRKGKEEGRTRHHVGWSRSTIPPDDV